IEAALGAEERPTEGVHRHGEPRAETNGAHPPEDRTERALDAETCVDPVLGEGHERRDGQRALRGGRRGAQYRARDHTGCPHGAVPSPAAGETSSTVAAIRSALRLRTLAFVESRSARRRAFAATFSGIAPCRRCTRNATTPVTAAVAARTSAPPRSPAPRSPLAAPAMRSAAAATPNPLATSRRAASTDIRSGSTARRSSSGTVSSRASTSCRRSKYTRAESDAPAGFAKGRQLGGREQARIEIGERVPLDRRAEVQDGGVALPRDRKAGAEVFVRVDTLVACHLERPVGGDDLTQQRQRPLDFE